MLFLVFTDKCIDTDCISSDYTNYYKNIKYKILLAIW